MLTRFPQLSETFILNRLTGQVERGHDLTIFSRPPVENRRHPDVDRFDLLAKARHCPSISDRMLPRALKAFGLLVTRMPHVVALLRSLNVARYGERAASLNLFYMAMPLLQDRPEFDVIHCHYGPIGLLGQALRQLGLIHGRLVTSFYGYDVTRHPVMRGSDVYQTLFRDGDLVLALSEHMKSQLIELGCPADKVRVHHLGVDVDRFSFGSKTRNQGEPLRLISVARLVEKKGLADAIAALAKLRDDGVDFEFRIVGGGPLEGALREQVVACKLEDSVTLLGWRVQDEVSQLLESAHVFVAPSVRARDGDEEGTPTAIIEAMARGLPVVSTIHSGIPEVVRDGETGFLVAEHDIDALADRIRRFSEQAELLPRMGRASRDVIEAEFDVAKLNDQLVTYYEGLS